VVGVDLELDGRRIQIVEVLSRDDKATRASPVSTLYSVGRVHHVATLDTLETEMSEWDPDLRKSPNGLDALVHLVTELCGLHETQRPDARVAFRGLAAANAKARSDAATTAREPTIAEPTRAQPTTGGLSAALAAARSGHWGSRL
jgi:hypothetical protein